MSGQTPAAVPADNGTVRLGVLFATLYFIQGVGEPVAGLISQPVRSILKSWGESPASISAFAAAVSIPWMLKPLYGIVSDFVPLWGSRRRSYLLLTSLLGLFGFIALYELRPAPGNYAWFLVLLITPTVAIAFGDVLVDALMVEKGQPLGLTGVLQSVQWAATYAATLLTGVVGGFLSQRGEEPAGFLICGGLAVATLVMSWKWVEEEPHTPRENLRATLRALGSAFRSPALLGVAVFLFAWSFDPLSNTVIYLHITEQMGLSEQFFGTTLSMLACGCILGSIGYGVYCRKVPMLWLAHGSILLGALSQAAYWPMTDGRSALVVHVVVGFAWMTASMIQLDLAARVCPPQVAATIFAALMALTNLGSSLAEWLAGMWYDTLLRELGGSAAFAAMIAIAVGFRLGCWLLFVLWPGRGVGWDGEPEATATA
ncbi:MAG: folate/biopterin family MFS transporter [Thermoanaerobaculia bacterium]|nr:folate/biopterin family MFS transporter [Thermoanaerobaculia bacterium]